MVIELLKIKVPPELQQEFIRKDAEIWTAALAEYDGYLTKQVWLNPRQPTEVTLCISWQSREQWKAIPQNALTAIEEKFVQELGCSCQIIESSEYEVYDLSK
ncbi:MAG: TIGR03792 family protein [Nostocaceae cyanobacterium]|nr:TIGR03792 family protein [Nostocaceae cyanobacterium]